MYTGGAGRLSAVSHAALGVAEGDHLAGHQLLHGDDGVAHLPNRGRWDADGGSGAVAAADPDLHSAGGELGHRLRR